ncbi:CD1375 family protein [Macrococcus capreoli]
MYLAMLYANRIALGKYEFVNVPEKLKEQVKEILIEAGLEELAA